MEHAAPAEGARKKTLREWISGGLPEWLGGGPLQPPTRQSKPVLLNKTMTAGVRPSLSSNENLAVGIVGGCVETAILMPVLTWKFCLQEGRPYPRSLGGIYRGVSVLAGSVAPLTGMQMFFNGGGCSYIANAEPCQLATRERAQLARACATRVDAPAAIGMNRSATSLRHRCRAEMAAARTRTRWGVDGHPSRTPFA